MYHDYKDIAEFRFVYINEAHALDGLQPNNYAKKKGITDHVDYGDRCKTARMFLDEKTLTIPCLIDGMDNKVNQAYGAWPDRIFVVRTDGKLAVAANRGPEGFKPGLDAIRAWLKQLSESGTEPELVTVNEETELDRTHRGANSSRKRRRIQPNKSNNDGDK